MLLPRFMSTPQKGSRRMQCPSLTATPSMLYRPLGDSGLKVSALTLRLGPQPEDRHAITSRHDAVHHALQHGVTHYTLAPQLAPGRTSGNFLPQPLQCQLRRQRGELVLSAHPPYGFPWPEHIGLNSRKHLTAALDTMLDNLEIDYLDLYCPYRYDPRIPLTETATALADAVCRGKVLHVGVAAWPLAPTRSLAVLLRHYDIPLTAHQSAFSLTGPEGDDGLLDMLSGTGTGCIAHLPHRPDSPTPCRSSVTPAVPCSADWDHSADVTALSRVASARGQSLSQLAISWALQQPAVASTAVTACHPSCLAHHLQALAQLSFTPREHATISQHTP
ncbi:hypothetical protein CTZ27_35310 [Streptomyces griseocarneus]|nr:hypothetical protein CTZ27_35310 [Streptomyces griseocarneus]